MKNIVLAPSTLGGRTRDALLRALQRFPAEIQAVDAPERPARLLAVARDADVEFVLLLDADAVLQPDAFGSIRRTAQQAPALIGGRALTASGQRFGDMFAPTRSGPDPFELVPILAPPSDRGLAEAVRGPIDVPQRGAVIVSAAFVRSLHDAELDPLLLHVDLAVQARVRGAAVVCEPQLSFAASDDGPELRRALGNLRRYAAVAEWHADDMHRDPPRVRAALISREVRVAGNIRGYNRQPYPPIDVLAVASDQMARARVARSTGTLALNGAVATCEPGDGDTLRRALARTSERYLLVCDAGEMPDRSRIERLVERLERSGRIALALERDTAPFGAALFHCARVVNGGAFAGAAVSDVVADAVRALPKRRSFAAGPSGRIVPDPLPPVPALQTVDVIYLAASRPLVSEQTLRAALSERLNGTITAVYPAGSSTLATLLATYPVLTVAPEARSPHLGVGLNRALGASTADAVAIVRDDIQLPFGTLGRMADAFRRIPSLGVAVPRVGGSDRPESLPDLGYRSGEEMELLYQRRAEAFAREATLLDVATAPVVMIRREALEVVGGFDETFGFSRVGVEDFSRRVRAANFLVACCDDAYAHVFPAEQADSLIAQLDGAPLLRASYQKRWSVARPFDPQTDRVPLRIEPPDEPVVDTVAGLRILLPLASAEEWTAVRPLVEEIAGAFRASDPIELAIGLDGAYGVQTIVAELHELMLATNVPMDETLNVNVDVVGDVALWRDAGRAGVRLAGVERDALAKLDVVGTVADIRAKLAGNAP